MKTNRVILAAIATGFLTAIQPLFGAAQAAAQGDPKPVTYANDVKPILDATCATCHNAGKPKAGLQMDSLEGVLKGTKKRQLVAPGKSADSRLVQLVESVAAAAKDPDGQTRALHKKGVKPLTPEQISQLKAWIDQGAK
ncbi:MAG: hypothetical protein NTW21_27350 [Verrucomicrobia bacterium]|nr:hypothetical protein [Verrucomicrobiota bacterium]